MFVAVVSQGVGARFTCVLSRCQVLPRCHGTTWPTVKVTPPCSPGLCFDIRSCPRKNKQDTENKNTNKSDALFYICSSLTFLCGCGEINHTANKNTHKSDTLFYICFVLLHSSHIIIHIYTYNTQ